MGLKQQVIKSLGWSTTATLVNTLAQVLRIAILARLLEASDFGLVAISLAVVAFCEIFSDLGFTIPLIHKQDITNKQYSSVFWVNVILSSAIYIILFFIAPIISKIYAESELTPIVRIIGLTVVINSLGKIFHTKKQKDLQFKFLSIVSISTCVIGFLTILFLALKGWGVYSLVYGTIVQISLRQFVYFISGMRSSTVSFHLNFAEIKDFFKIGGYQVCSLISDFIVSKVDVFILGKMVGMTDLGYYNMAKEFILKCYGLLSTVSKSVMTAALAKVQNDTFRTGRIYAVYSELTSYAGLLLFLFMYLFSSLVSNTMYGGNSIHIEPLFKILCLYGFFTSLILPSASLTMAKGRTDIVFLWTLITAFLSLLFTSLSALYGLYAVVYTQVLISVLFFVLCWKFILNILLDHLSFFNYLSWYHWSILLMIVAFILIKLFSINNVPLLTLCYALNVIAVGLIFLKKGLFKYIKN